jgi:choice-of-anchor A domain-containing protein
LANFALNIEGLNATQLLWNFCNATNIRVEFVRLQGSVLAPQAHLSLGNMAHQGSIVAGSLDASFASQSSARFGGFFCPAASPSASPSP